MVTQTPLYMGIKEIAGLHQVTPRTAWTIAKKIKLAFGKETHQPITVSEYALYMNVPEDDVLRALRR